MLFRYSILVLSVICSSNAAARLYQWTEPDTETTQLSGKPPAWYRSTGKGPRVFVFENGRLIDDTGVKVSEEVRQHLRQQAFILVEEDKQEAKEKIEKANELKEKFKQTEQPPPIEEAENPEEREDEQPVLSERIIEEDTDKLSDESMNEEKLKELISEWEKAQTEKARQSLK